MLIFDRWGELLFEANDLNTGWDGTYNGQAQAMDSYYYNLDITYTNGVKRKKSGKFALLK